MFFFQTFFKTTKILKSSKGRVCFLQIILSPKSTRRKKDNSNFFVNLQIISNWINQLNMKKIFIISLLIISRLLVSADEGMWIPLFLGYNENEMQQMGFRLTADDVYSVNHHSMKDGIVLFGKGGHDV